MLVIIALIFFVPVFITYIKTGLVPQMPTLVMCGFVVLAAIQSYFSGLILSTIAQKSKQDFEYKLVQTEDKLKKFKSENSDKKVKGGEL